MSGHYAEGFTEMNLEISEMEALKGIDEAISNISIDFSLITLLKKCHFHDFAVWKIDFENMCDVS